MKKYISAFLFVSLLICSSAFGQGIATKGPLGAQDMHLFDGVNHTYTRPSSIPGRTITLNSANAYVDVLITFGGGVSYTDATITSALAAIGTTNQVTLVLRPGIWVISQNKDWSAYTNVTFSIMPGAYLSHGSFTLNIPNFNAGRQQVFIGTGAVTFSGTPPEEIYPELWAASNADSSDSSVQNQTTIALQAAINSATNPTVSLLQGGTYPINNYINIPNENSSLIASGVATIKNYNTSGAHAIRIGDLTETSADALHLQKPVVLKNITVVGNPSSGQGIRSYNAQLYWDHVSTVSNGSDGMYLIKSWGSTIIRPYSQINGGNGFVCTNGCNAVTIIQPEMLSHASTYGMLFLSGTEGVFNVTVDTPDLEGNLVGIKFDSSTGGGGLQGIVLINPTFLSNINYGIEQAATGNLDNLVLLAPEFYGSGNGAHFTTLRYSKIQSPIIYNCNLVADVIDNTVLENPKIAGTVTISGFQGLAQTLTVATQTGAASQTVPFADRTEIDILTGNDAITGLTLNFTNDIYAGSNAAWQNKIIELRIANASNSSGTITFAGGTFKTTGAFSIPSLNHCSSIRFQRDGNGIWWETSRATDAG